MQRAQDLVGSADLGNQSFPGILVLEIRLIASIDLLHQAVAQGGEPAVLDEVSQVPKHSVQHQGIPQGRPKDAVELHRRPLQPQEPEIPGDRVQITGPGILVPELVVHVIHVIGITDDEHHGQQSGDVLPMHQGVDRLMLLQGRAVDPTQQRA